MESYSDWKEIVLCNLIISSSLHGLIVSDVYNIPNVWVEFAGAIGGDHFKYLDYFQFVGRMAEFPLDLSTGIDDYKI